MRRLLPQFPYAILRRTTWSVGPPLVWRLLLRCGACGTWHETFARDEPVAALQRAIERGVQAVRSQLDAFCEALELDLIGPDEF
jgi:hypothetical protein